MPVGRSRISFLAPIVALLTAAMVSSGFAAEDNHAGYYYPDPSSRETYVSRANTMEDANREVRLGFVIALTQKQLSERYAPSYAMFAKGDEANKMIVVAQGESGFRSLYQARGLLAQLTAVARSSQLFQELAVEDVFTFFDLAKLIGFKQITVTDGLSFAHQVKLE